MEGLGQYVSGEDLSPYVNTKPCRAPRFSLCLLCRTVVTAREARSLKKVTYKAHRKTKSAELFILLNY